jgi:hypothetical protein
MSPYNFIRNYNVFKRTVTVRTKLNKNDKNPKVTVLTFDFKGVTLEDLAGPAIDSLTINKQGAWRRSGKVPTTETVLVSDMIARMGSRSGGPITVDSVAAQFAALSPSDQAKLLKQAEAAKAAPKAPAAQAERKNKGFPSQPKPAAPEAPKGDGEQAQT